MNHWDKQQFSRDLSKLLQLIRQHDVPVDTASLYKLEGQFPSKQEYCVNISDVVFTINSKTAHTIPHQVNKVAVYLEHICDLDLTKDTLVNDPIKDTYLFQMKIIGYSDEGEFFNFWHLDKNQKGNSGHKVDHPYYHFHSGGDQLEGIDNGAIIFMRAPRLAHPPMDLFLGFHFIINNFYNSKYYEFVSKILEDEEYQDIISRSQKRFWEPYFNSYHPENKHTDYTFNNVFPLFLKN